MMNTMIRLSDFLTSELKTQDEHKKAIETALNYTLMLMPIENTIGKIKDVITGSNYTSEPNDLTRNRLKYTHREYITIMIDAYTSLITKCSEIIKNDNIRRRYMYCFLFFLWHNIGDTAQEIVTDDTLLPTLYIIFNEKPESQSIRYYILKDNQIKTKDDILRCSLDHTLDPYFGKQQ
jgi:hypothetical protein